MPLPENFNEFEHLQDLIRKEHNKAVKNYFKNQEDNDISTPKAGLKHACLIKDEDTSTMTVMRMWLFEITVGHAQAVQRPVYGIPITEAQTNWKFKPQICLKFLEPYDHELHGKGEARAEGEISFRLMHETSESITRPEVERLALKIKQELAKPTAFVWSKGWFKSTYQDFDRGYDFRLYVKSKAEAKQVIEKVLSIQGHPFERDYFQFIEHDRTYPANPGTHRVYGQTRKKYVKRPRVDVKFRYAQLIIQGLPNAINLVAMPGVRLRSVIEQV